MMVAACVSSVRFGSSLSSESYVISASSASSASFASSAGSASSASSVSFVSFLNFRRLVLLPGLT